MDHCISSPTMTLPAIGCYQQYDCRPTLDGTKELCEVRPCVVALPQPQYVCRKPDGTQYLWQQEITGSNPAAKQEP